MRFSLQNNTSYSNINVLYNSTQASNHSLFSERTTQYSYGMNGQEKDDEIFQGAMTAEYWEYDSRLGRRWETDPLAYAFQSPYACFNNNPIFFADPSGLEGEGGGGGGGDHTYSERSGGIGDHFKRDSHMQSGEPSSAFVGPMSLPRTINVPIKDFPIKTPPTVAPPPAILPWVNATLIGSMIFLKGDKSPTPAERALMKKSEVVQTVQEAIYNNDYGGLKIAIDQYNKESNDRLVLRYVSLNEFVGIDLSGNRLLDNVDPSGNMVNKFITPDVYTYKNTAKAFLALKTAPDIALVTFESAILATKLPAGPGIYSKVTPANGGGGGGREATIFQPFPVIGFFILR